MLVLVVLLLTFVIVSFSVSRIIGVHLVSEQVENTARIMDQIAVQAAAPFASSDAEGLEKICEQNWKEYGGRVLILDTNGVVQADSFFRFERI